MGYGCLLLQDLVDRCAPDTYRLPGLLLSTRTGLHFAPPGKAITTHVNRFGDVALAVKINDGWPCLHAIEAPVINHNKAPDRYLVVQPPQHLYCRLVEIAIKSQQRQLLYCLCVCVCVCVCVCLCVCLCVCVYIYVCMCIYVYIYIYIWLQQGELIACTRSVLVLFS